MGDIPDRDEIDAAYKWDLSTVFADDAAWEDAFEAAQDRVAALAEQETDAFESAAELLDVLELRDRVMRDVAMVTKYARMRSDEDTRVEQYQAMRDRAETLSAEASSAASFIRPAIQQLDRDTVDDWLADEPGLAPYEHYLDDVLRMKPYTLPAEQEALLADLSPVIGGHDVFSMLTNADMTFPPVEGPDGGEVALSLSNATTLLQRRDRDFRERVHTTLYDTLGDHRHVLASALKQTVKAHVIAAEQRGYDSARAAALHASNIPPAVYDTLVETVEDRLDLLQRHTALKARAHGLDEPAMWDLYAPIAPGDGPEVPFDEAREHVLDAVAALGDDYRSRVQDGLDSRWVDVYENRGKRSGAYSSGTYDTQPFILMNYQDDISSMFTLAHELGHSFRLHVLDQYLERFRSTLFRQTMFAAFEHRIHQLEQDGTPLTADRLDETYGSLKHRYYDNVQQDDSIRGEWMRIPHFHYDFYVYQYATRIAAATALAQQIRDEDGARERYLDFLRAGGSDYPLQLLRDTGVDMTDAAPVNAALDVYSYQLDRIAALLG